MLSVLEDPAVRARVPAFTVENYHRLYEAGAIAENVELIRGAIVEKMPKSPLHASIVTLLGRHLLAKLSDQFHVRSEQPITLSDSELEPDLAIIRGPEEDFRLGHPRVAEVVMEVVVTSERIDRLKLDIYAEAGVPECWLILAKERVIERHTEPRGGVYTKTESVGKDGALVSTVFSSSRCLFKAFSSPRGKGLATLARGGV